MTALPVNRQSAILSSGYSPWQAPLAAMFAGLSAAGQPGGWNNFGVGAAQGAQQFQSNVLAQEQSQRAREQFQMERERFEADQRRANQEEAEREAQLAAIRSFFPAPGQQGQTASAPAAPRPDLTGVPPHARQSAILGMGKLEADMSRPGGATPRDAEINNMIPGRGQSAMLSGFGFNPQQSVLFSKYAEANPEAAFSMLMQRAFAQQQPDQTRTRIDGTDEVFEQYDTTTGDWLELSRGPRWQQNQGQGMTERQRNALAAGLEPGTPEYEQYILGRDDNEGGGPFEGNAMDAQASNILLTGDAASPEYAAAYAHLAQPKVQFDPTTNKLVTVSPDLSWAAKPGQQGAAGGNGAPLPLMPSVTGNRAGPTVQNAQTLPQQPAASGIQGTETLQVPGATITSTPGTGLSPADRTKLRTVKAEADAIRSSLNRFRDVVNETGFGARASAFGGGMTEGGRKLNAAWTNAAIMTKAEALFNLGVLNGPDLSVIQGTLPNPSTAEGAVASDAAYSAAIDEVLRLIDSKVAAYESQFGGGTTTPAAPTAGGTRVDQLPQGNWQ